MILKYSKIVGCYGDEEDCTDFDYEVDWDDEVVALATFIYKDYFKDKRVPNISVQAIKDGLIDFISDFGDEEVSRWEEQYYENLLEWFEPKAYEYLLEVDGCE